MGLCQIQPSHLFLTPFYNVDAPNRCEHLDTHAHSSFLCLTLSGSFSFCVLVSYLRNQVTASLKVRCTKDLKTKGSCIPFPTMLCCFSLQMECTQALLDALQSKYNLSLKCLQIIKKKTNTDVYISLSVLKVPLTWKILSNSVL